MTSPDWNLKMYLFNRSHCCLILPFRFSRFQACFRQRPPPYRPPSLRCGCPGGQSSHSVLQGGGQPWAHYPMAKKWPTSWHRQDGCAITAYRFARRKFVLLQRRPWPKESVPWSGVRLCGSQQCRGRDKQKCLSSYSRFESWQSVILSNIKGIVHLKIKILSIFTLMLLTFRLWIMKEHIFNKVVHTMKGNRVQNNLDGQFPRKLTCLRPTDLDNNEWPIKTYWRNKRVRKLIKMVHEITRMSKFALLPETNRALIELWKHAVFVAQTDSSAGSFTRLSTGLEQDQIETLKKLLHTMNLHFVYIYSLLDNLRHEQATSRELTIGLDY